MPVKDLITIYPVDWEIPANKLKRAYIADVASNYAIWGNGVSEPQFAITDLHINASSIMAYGENQGFIRFTYNGITFTKKYCPAGDYDKMTMRTRKTFGVNKTPLVLNIIGQFVLNAWEDKVNPEVKILYYDVQKDETKEESKQIKNTEIHKTKTTKTQIYDGGTSYASEVAKTDSGKKTLVNSQSLNKNKKSEDEDVEVWILDGNVEDKPKKKTLTIDDDFLF